MRALELFCGAGGSATGYNRAGFDIVGVDIKPQPRFPFPFVQGDALEYVKDHGHEYEVVFASPPCQAYIRSGMVAKDGRHPDLLPATRELLEATGLPYVIENVPGAPMRPDIILCGSMFGLNVRRHRWFESNANLPPWTLTCDHSKPITGVYGHPHGKGGAFRNGKRPMLPSDLATWSHEMGIGWMKARELAIAIPPAFTEFVGLQLLEAIR